MANELSNDPPIVPIGTDAYVDWRRLPFQRIGVRAYMPSTYDRAGNNFGADGGHFLYQERDDFNVVLDEKGPGVLYFVRTNHFHGSPWHYEIDGKDNVIKETATDDPIGADKKYPNSRYLPEEAFPIGLTHTWSTTQGADIMQAPMPFASSLRFAMGRTYYGTSYAILHKFAKGTDHLSQPVRPWTPVPPDARAAAFITSNGSDLTAGDEVTKASGAVTVGAGETVTVAKLDGGPTTLRSLRFSVAEADAFDFGSARLRIFWDDAALPSVDAPVALFFGVGSLFNKDARPFLSKGLMANVEYTGGRVELSCYWPMPFFRTARIEIVGAADQPSVELRYEIGTEPYAEPLNHAAYFHATYTDHPEAVEGQYIQFLDTDAVEGGGPWAGHIVGLTWILTHTGRVMLTVEGHPRFILDDSRTPQGVGTGTEEFAGGGDHWKGGRYSSCPLFGHPLGRMGGKKGDDPRELLNSAYRFLVADLIPFGKRAVLELKHGPRNNSREHYEGVAYWYGVNDAALVLTDTVDVCGSDDTTHGITSEGAQPAYTLRSRFEFGPHEDYPDQREYYEEHEEPVRITTGVTEFDVALDKDNLGVMLRRRFDYRYPNQCAAVSVFAGGEWHDAGQWYVGGSSTCVFSNPTTDRNFTQAELNPTQHNVRDSGKRWKEDEFLLPRHLTQGRERIRIRLAHVPVERELFPGHPFPEKSAWSESRYFVFSYKLPRSPSLNG